MVSLVHRCGQRSALGVPKAGHLPAYDARAEHGICLDLARAPNAEIQQQVADAAAIPGLEFGNPAAEIVGGNCKIATKRDLHLSCIGHRLRRRSNLLAERTLICCRGRIGLEARGRQGGLGSLN
jgi:hypothetical protein